MFKAGETRMMDNGKEGRRYAELKLTTCQFAKLIFDLINPLRKFCTRKKESNVDIVSDSMLSDITPKGSVHVNENRDSLRLPLA